MISKQILLLVVVALCLALIQCGAPRNFAVTEPAYFGNTTEIGELARVKRAPAPWWCDAAVAKCNGSEDPCCYGYWASPQDACNSACAQCGRSC